MNEFVCVRVSRAETVENFQQTKRGLHDLHGVRGLKSAFKQVICLFFGWSTSGSLTECGNILRVPQTLRARPQLLSAGYR